MSPSQFQTLLDRLDKFEERFNSRLLRVEISLATLSGGILVVATLFINNKISI